MVTSRAPASVVLHENGLFRNTGPSLLKGLSRNEHRGWIRFSKFRCKAAAAPSVPGWSHASYQWCSSDTKWKSSSFGHNHYFSVWLFHLECLSALSFIKYSPLTDSKLWLMSDDVGVICLGFLRKPTSISGQFQLIFFPPLQISSTWCCF